MSFTPVVVTFVVAGIIGYFVYKKIEEDKLMLESSSKVLRAVAIFIQFIMYIAMVGLAIASMAVLLNKGVIGDFVDSLDLEFQLSSTFFDYSVDGSRVIVDNLVRFIIVFTPLVLYGLFISSLIAKTSAKIFKILSEGVVFSSEIVAHFKRVIIYLIFLFPVRLFDLTLKNEHDFNIGINFNFIALFVFFYVIYSVYKRAFDVHEESKLTI